MLYQMAIAHRNTGSVWPDFQLEEKSLKPGFYGYVFVSEILWSLMLARWEKRSPHVPNKTHVWATFTSRAASVQSQKNRVKFPFKGHFVCIFINSTNISLAPNRIIFIFDWPGETLLLWEKNSRNAILRVLKKKRKKALAPYFLSGDVTT